MSLSRIVDATYHENMFRPRIAAYVFNEEGGLVRSSLIDKYHALQMGLRPDFSREELMGTLGYFIANNIGSCVRIRSPAGASQTTEIDAMELGNFLCSRPGTAGVMMPAPGSEDMPGKPEMGLFVERIETPRWAVDGAIRNAPVLKEMVTVVRDTTWGIHDSTLNEQNILESSGYVAARKDIVSALLSDPETMSALASVKAVIHDLRGTLRYKGLHLAYADYRGMCALLDATDKPQIRYIATVTSGTKSEGTNFLTWANVLGHPYTHYKTFAIADSLTSAIDVLTPGYSQIKLVRDGAIDGIKSSIEELATSGGSQYAPFLNAYEKWKSPDTAYSIIIDIPPCLTGESETEILNGAQGLMQYHRGKRDENISVIHKAATTGGLRSVRLYIRPGFLESGVPIGKGPALAEYFSRNGINDPMHTIIYFADNFSTPEEITLGKYSSVGFEIKQGSEPVAEFGKYGVPALVTAPTYMVAADIAATLLDNIMPKPRLINY